MRSWRATWRRLRRCRICSARLAGTGCRPSRYRPTNGRVGTARSAAGLHGDELAVVDTELDIEVLADIAVASDRQQPPSMLMADVRIAALSACGVVIHKPSGCALEPSDLA
jgi:hypothetical protein